MLQQIAKKMPYSSVAHRSQTQLGTPAILTNWSMTAQSSCVVVKARNTIEITQALAQAQAHGQTVIPQGGGYSFTDAALNTNGIIINVTEMRRILDWDPLTGIMRVEPGVTLQDITRISLEDGWWPTVTPSTPSVTIGGCVAMNVMGKNAWKCGSFGEHVLSLNVLLASGEPLTLTPERDAQVFQAFVGSAGLLGVITSITLQLRRITSASVAVQVRPAASLDEIATIFAEEQSADFLEALVDGFATGHRLGRGIVTCTRFCDEPDNAGLHLPTLRFPESVTTGLARSGGRACRPVARAGTRIANSLIYARSRQRSQNAPVIRSLYHSAFYPPAAFASYQALLPQGITSFQAFIPRQHAVAVFTTLLRRSQAEGLIPLLCVIKQHRRDPFLLSYQVDGFSLEAYYAIAAPTLPRLQQMLRGLTYLALAAGGKFYLAKDALLTPALYRQSVGNAAVDTFLTLKQHFDPAMLFQSDLFRRVLLTLPNELELSDHMAPR